MEMTQEHLENLKGLRCDRPRQDGQHQPRIPGTNHSHLVANPTRCWDFCSLFLIPEVFWKLRVTEIPVFFREVFSVALKKRKSKKKDQKKKKIPTAKLQQEGETLPKNQCTKAAVTGDRTGPGAEEKLDALWKESKHQIN